MKRIAVLAVFTFALMGPADAKPADAAGPAAASAETAAAAARPVGDGVAAAPVGSAAAAAARVAGPAVAPAAPVPAADREFYALLGAALLAIGALFWRRRGGDDEA